MNSTQNLEWLKSFYINTQNLEINNYLHKHLLPHLLWRPHHYLNPWPTIHVRHNWFRFEFGF